jgi:hypothetical protein
LTILFGYIFVFHFGMIINPFLNSPRRHYDCLLALLLHLGLAVALVCLFGWLTWVLALEFPLFLAAALGSYLFYAQHNFPGVSFNDKGGWTYEKAALESSSYLKTGPLMSWFTANIGYHHIHHLNHRVPFYRLPELYRDLPELRQAKTTSLRPFDIIRCLRLKVWDFALNSPVMQPEKFTQKSQEALQEAQRLAREYSHQEIDGEHLALALIGQTDSLIPDLLERIGVPVARLKPDLEAELARRHKVQGGGDPYAGAICARPSTPRNPRPPSSRTITSAPNICCSACWTAAVRR